MELEDLILYNNIIYYFYHFNNELLINIDKKNISNKLLSYTEIILYHKYTK